jgi:hypothetical protein
MVIVHLAGGLGNQMFQYATARRLAHLRKVPLKLDLSSYGLDGDTQVPGLEAFRRHVRLKDFRIAAEQAAPHEIAALVDPYINNSRWTSRMVRQLRRFWPALGVPSTHFQERRYRFDPEVLTLTTPRYLAGFWQSEMYFMDVRDVILDELTPSDPAIREYADRYVANIREPGMAVVSLHVRRGELAVAQDVLKSKTGVFGVPTGLDYIQQAMQRFENGCKFLVFSDSAPDIEWCRQNIKADRLHFSEGHTDVRTCF